MNRNTRDTRQSSINCFIVLRELIIKHMIDFFHHLFLPKHTNNHRPKILHHQNLLFISFLLLIFSFALPYGRAQYPEVLGTTINIRVAELLQLTNEVRHKYNLNELTLNEQLNRAALLKAEHMFQADYWAHNAPDGTTPWEFLKKAGYDYFFAGENLARGFSTSKEVVDAWMGSEGHKKNILSSDYQDIGFAIETGKLTGSETVLVVEMFGSKTAAPLAKRIIQQDIVVPNDAKAVQAEASPDRFGRVIFQAPVVDSSMASRNLSIFLVAIFILVLIIDMVIIERKKIARLAGHNLDHIMFLSVILILIIIAGKQVAIL